MSTSIIRVSHGVTTNHHRVIRDFRAGLAARLELDDELEAVKISRVFLFFKCFDAEGPGRPVPSSR